MKTLIQNFKPLKRCDRTLSNALYLLWQLPLPAVSYFLAKTRLKIYEWTVALPICLGGLTVEMTERTLNSLSLSVKEVIGNKRLMSGLMVGLVAFPLWKCHLFFDINQEIPDFYYVNWAFYFNTIRAYVCGLFLATGFFIAAPQKWAFKWWALPVAIFCGTEIYEQSFYTHWTHFYNPMPNWQVTLIMLFCMPALYFSVDYLCYRKYHLKDGNIARIIGIIKAPGIETSTKMEILSKLVNESESFNERV